MYLGGIKNIVFDFGGVLYKINPTATIEAFLTNSNVIGLDEKQLVSNKIFLEYEKGKINSDQFRDEIRKNLKNELIDSEIDRMWNLTLVETFEKSYLLIKSLKNRGYKLALLSNTNEIHFNYFIKEVRHIFEMFDFLIFSYQVQSRKPDIEIYQKMLQISGFNPKETIFVDDSNENIEGAKSSGLKTYHVTDAEKLWENFHSV